MSSVSTDDLTAPVVPVQRSAEGPSWAAVVAVMFAQLAGNGVVIVHHGMHPSSDIGRYHPGLVVIAAAVVVLIGLAATLTPDAPFRFAPARGWRSLVPDRPGYVIFGVAVALLLPLVWGLGTDNPVGPTAFIYSLIWGTGLAAVGWLQDRAAVLAGVSVLVSAVVCAVFAVSIHMPGYNPPASD
jgi:hypothetical protein